ncbi:MAG: hypothetical protein WCG29_10590 [Desulfomonile sp.]
MANRLGEKAGWIGGWCGGFLWVLLLSVMWVVKGRGDNRIPRTRDSCYASYNWGRGYMDERTGNHFSVP